MALPRCQPVSAALFQLWVFAGGQPSGVGITVVGYSGNDPLPKDLTDFPTPKMSKRRLL